MTEKYFIGHDCCRDALKPTKKPTIYPKKIALEVGQSIKLYLRAIHPGCYQSCYSWKILYGGGWLNTETGIEVWYHAPSDNTLCLSNPVIEASCTRGPLDRIYIAVNGLPKPIPAVLVIGNWKKHKFELDKIYPHLVGMKYCDKEPRVEYWGITVREYGCDGSFIARYHQGLVSQLIQARCGIKIYTDRFAPAPPPGVDWIIGFYPYWGTLEAAKQYALRKLIDNYNWTFRERLWRQFKIKHGPLPKELLSPMIPGVKVDVRVYEVYEMDCCPYLLAERSIFLD